MARRTNRLFINFLQIFNIRHLMANSLVFINGLLELTLRTLNIIASFMQYVYKYHNTARARRRGFRSRRTSIILQDTFTIFIHFIYIHAIIQWLCVLLHLYFLPLILNTNSNFLGAASTRREFVYIQKYYSYCFAIVVVLVSLVSVSPWGRKYHRQVQLGEFYFIWMQW